MAIALLGFLVASTITFPALLILDAIRDRIRDRHLYRNDPSPLARLRAAWRVLRTIRPRDLVPNGPGEWVLAAVWLPGVVLLAAAAASALV